MEIVSWARDQSWLLFGAILIIWLFDHQTASIAEIASFALRRSPRNAYRGILLSPQKDNIRFFWRIIYPMMFCLPMSPLPGSQAQKLPIMKSLWRFRQDNSKYLFKTHAEYNHGVK